MKSREHPIDACMRTLFRRCPALCGFTVDDSSALFVGEITTQPYGVTPHRELCRMIAAQLSALIDECPEARELLRDRTFARVFH
jgi:hypothetical protein